MTTSIEKRLLTTLDQTLKEYDKLRNVLRDKRDALVEDEFDAIRETTEREGILADQLAELENRRKQLWDEILPGGTTNEDYDLEALYEFVPTEDHEQFERRRKALKKVVRDVRRINDENTALLETRLSTYDQLFNVMLGVDDDQRTYGRDRQAETQKSGDVHLIDEAI